MTKMILIMYDDTPCLTVGGAIKSASLSMAKFFSRIQDEKWVSNFYNVPMPNMMERDSVYFTEEFDKWKKQDRVSNIGEFIVRQADCNQVDILKRQLDEHKVMYDVFEDWNIPLSNHYKNEGSMISETCMLIFLDSQMVDIIQPVIKLNTQEHY